MEQRAAAQHQPSNEERDDDLGLVGKTVSHYRVDAKLGSGGMGTVYKATDTKLGRQVALKLLRSELVEDATSKARFEREARALGSLNHPNIAAIYGFEESDGMRFLSLEYVEGPTLAERLRRGALPIRDTISVGLQIAQALEAAHAKNIIHRDLKPSNIKVTENGQVKVKVLDFGLAKTIEPLQAAVEATAATLSEQVTQRMSIVGTPAYMSPEQVSGKELDSRTDIWSFACVLYEAVTGKLAFRGTTTTEVLAAVLEREPDWTILPAATPASLERLLKRCLRKDPSSRLRDIGDARIDLEDTLTTPGQVQPAAKGVMTRRTAISALAGVAAGVAAGVLGSNWQRGQSSRGTMRLRLPVPEGGILSASFNRRVAISPDGTHVVFNVLPSASLGSAPPASFFIHSIHDLEPKPLKAQGGGAFFSPNGQLIGYLSPAGGNIELRKIGLGGGAPATVCKLENFIGATWADDDTIYLVSTVPGGLMRVPAGGGEPKECGGVDFASGERQHRFPCALPGAKEVLLTVSTADSETFDDAHIVVLNTENGRRKTLIEGGTHPRYSPSGHLVYARNGSLLAVRFDAKRLEITGQPFTVLEGVQMSRNSGVANYDVSASGDLVYIGGPADKGERKLVWVDRNGKAEPLPLPPRAYLHPRISPDMRQLAVEIEGPNHHLYVYDFARAVLSQMTTDGVSHWPLWSPDGKELLYRAGRMGRFRMWKIPADRSAPPAQLPGTGTSQSAESWSPDGRTIAYTTVAGFNSPPQIFVESLGGDYESRLFFDTRAAAGSPKFSPDGRWLAYCSNESGKAQVYVQAFPGPGPKIQISSDGGTDPVWNGRGGELYYRNGDSMMAVAVTTAPTFRAGRPQELWRGHYSHGMSTSCGPAGATSSNYDVTADGRRFLMIKDEAPDTAVSREIVVVLNWADEVGRLSRA